MLRKYDVKNNKSTYLIRMDMTAIKKCLVYLYLLFLSPSPIRMDHISFLGNSIIPKINNKMDNLINTHVHLSQ